MKKLILIFSLILFVGNPTAIFGQEKKTKKTQTTKTLKTKKPSLQTSTPKGVILAPNTKPMVLQKTPVLKVRPELFDRIKALKKVTLNDQRDSSDKTSLEVTSSNSTNNVRESGPQDVLGPNNCYSSTKTLDITTTDFSYFTETSIPDFVKPGVVIHYQSILDGSNTINTTPRHPMTIYLINTSAIQGLNNLSIDIVNPQSISGINNALGSLTGKLRTRDIPANMSFEITEINSEKQLQYAISGSYSYGSFVSAKFGVSGSDYSNAYYYLIKFTQNMYTISTDPNTVQFIDTPNSSNQLAYVSDVTYGRKGLMMIKTNKSMSEIKAEMNVSANYGIQKGNIQGMLNSINRDSSSSVHVFFYGGSSSVAARSLQANDMKQGFDKWVEAEAGNGLLALPISYRIKNLKGEQLSIGSIFKQTNRTCVPAKKLELKVTLMGIEAWNTEDRDEKADYGLTQHIKYIAKGKVKTPKKKHYQKFPNKTNCDRRIGGKWAGSIPMICGDMQNQIHVNTNKGNNRQYLNNIGNYVVFEITPEEANDTRATFEVQNWAKEYSNTDILMNLDFSVPQQIPIHHLLAELQNISDATYNEAYARDGSLRDKIFKNFSGSYTEMAKIKDDVLNKKYLDAVFRARNSESKLREKAFIWLRFELIE